MAIVSLKDVEVISVHQSGNGVKVAEKFEVNGQPRQTIFTIWFDEASGLREGDIVSLSGFLGTKVRSWTDQQSGEERYGVEHSVNKPRINSKAPETVPSTEGWGNTNNPWEQNSWGG